MELLIRKSLFLLCILALILGFFSTSSAQIRPGSMSLAPQLGWFVFDDDENIDDSAYLGLSFRSLIYENWGIEAALGYVGTETDNSDVNVNTYLTNFNVLYHFMSFDKFVPYLTAGLGGKSLDPDQGDGDTDAMFNYGAGADYFLNENLSLRFDVKHLLSLEDSENNFLGTIGLAFFFGGAKAVAAPPPPPPEPPKDSDGDGVPDDQDKCLGTPAGVKVDPTGCPLDTDGDGVYDYLDKCPDTGKWIRVDKEGCPLDDDQDGVPNHLDQCPLTPEGVKVDSKGCPLDTDRDGVFDYLDKCPDTPAGAKVDARGCWVLQGVYFDTNKADIKPQYYPILDEAVSVMKKNPDLRIEVQGHTDSTGNRNYNQQLSERRAQSVLEYFADNGIARTRLSARGYGQDKPIASNDTSEGRATNRRVELKPIR